MEGTFFFEYIHSTEQMTDSIKNERPTDSLINESNFNTNVAIVVPEKIK